MAAITRVGVIGAGTMGGGIAAHLANAGLQVVLLDRGDLAGKALARMAKADPAPFMSRRNRRLVTTGSIEDDLGRLGDCDWVVEAIVEDPKAKRELYARLDPVLREDAIVSSNTSTLPLAVLGKGMAEARRRRFFITHFFNPPRYMRLMELVSPPDKDSDAERALASLADRALGKGVVVCNDTPGFIANRLGIYWLQCAVTEAMESELPIEHVDAVFGPAIGLPKTGVFGLLDLVGLDLMPAVLGGMAEALPPDDPFQDVYIEPHLIKSMIADGYTGRKGKGGFYRLVVGKDGSRTKEALDLTSGAYRTASRPRLECVDAIKRRGLRALFDADEPAARLGRSVLGRTLAYGAHLVPGAAHSAAAVDEAMRLGYAWERGPFAMIDELGPAWLADRLEEDGITVPAFLESVGRRSFYIVRGREVLQAAPDGDYVPVRRPKGTLRFEDIERIAEPLAANAGARLWDLGESVLCVSLCGKMNALGPESFAMLGEAMKQVRRRKAAGLVIFGEGGQFSAGANLGLALFAANIAAWGELDAQLKAGQDTFAALRDAPFPVVGAPSGLALGGGCELLMHCDAVQAHAETYMGLVEAGVGIVPGWGGCRALLRRCVEAQAAGKMPRGPMPPVMKAFETIATAQVAKSAFEAKEMLLLNPSDGITMNKDRLLFDARTRVLELAASGYRPPEAFAPVLPGPGGRTALELVVHNFLLAGRASPHDAVVAGALAEVLSGGATDITATVDEATLAKLERRAVLRLARHPASLARMEHMLETGKPLRN